MTIESRKAPHYRELQKVRLAEVQAMTVEAWQELLRALHRPSTLPKSRQHFIVHRLEFEELGITTQQQLEGFFADHLQRPDLALFTYISTQKGTQYRHWALVGMDNGVVALYNETKGRFWSFYRPRSFHHYMALNRSWWIRVDAFADKPEVLSW